MRPCAPGCASLPLSAAGSAIAACGCSCAGKRPIERIVPGMMGVGKLALDALRDLGGDAFGQCQPHPQIVDQFGRGHAVKLESRGDFRGGEQLAHPFDVEGAVGIERPAPKRIIEALGDLGGGKAPSFSCVTDIP